MVLTNRKKLATIMTIQEVSQRELAEAIGWKSHSYLGRLLRGEVASLDEAGAVRIAKYLGVPVEDLFATRMSIATERTVDRRATRRAA